VGGIEKDAIRMGNFFNVTLNFSIIEIGKGLKLNFSPSAFYLMNPSPFKGFFVSETATAFMKNYKLGLYNQVVVPVVTTPASSLNWNIGLIYRF
jgi:hypothetical protein